MLGAKLPMPLVAMVCGAGDEPSQLCSSLGWFRGCLGAKGDMCRKFYLGNASNATYRAMRQTWCVYFATAKQATQIVALSLHKFPCPTLHLTSFVAPNVEAIKRGLDVGGDWIKNKPTAQH